MGNFDIFVFFFPPPSGLFLWCLENCFWSRKENKEEGNVSYRMARAQPKHAYEIAFRVSMKKKKKKGEGGGQIIRSLAKTADR